MDLGTLAVRTFFSSTSRLSDTAESELKQIVDYRNEAAHGRVDQVVGPEILIEVSEFFQMLLMSISDFVQYDMIRRAKELGKAVVVGVISERFRSDIVVAKIANSSISLGDNMFVFGKGIVGEATIGSIQLDDVNEETITVVDEREVGLALGMRAKVGCELLRLQ